MNYDTAPQATVSPGRSRWGRLDWVLTSLLATSLLCNTLLTFLVVSGPAAPSAFVAVQRSPRVGDVLPVLSGERIDGSKAVVEFAAADKTLVYFWHPACIWCDRNASDIRALISHARSKVAIVAISSRSVSSADAIDKGLLPEDVIANVSTATLAAYHLRATPQTMLVDRSGRVEHVWVGAFTDPTALAIEQTFGVVLPSRLSSRPR